MNPFDLPGPQFLTFFITTFAVALAVAVWMRWALREPTDEPTRKALNLSPYEVAYLAGNEELAFNTAVIRLVHEDAIEVSNRKLTHGGTPVAADSRSRLRTRCGRCRPSDCWSFS